jgi:hypothetical protein
MPVSLKQREWAARMQVRALWVLHELLPADQNKNSLIAACNHAFKLGVIGEEGKEFFEAINKDANLAKHNWSREFWAGFGLDDGYDIEIY